MKDVEPALPIASPLMRFLFGLNNPISWSCDASGWFNTAQSPNLQQKKKKEKEKRKRKKKKKKEKEKSCGRWQVKLGLIPLSEQVAA